MLFKEPVESYFIVRTRPGVLFVNSVLKHNMFAFLFDSSWIKYSIRPKEYDAILWQHNSIQDTLFSKTFCWKIIKLLYFTQYKLLPPKGHINVNWKSEKMTEWQSYTIQSPFRDLSSSFLLSEWHSFILRAICFTSLF